MIDQYSQAGAIAAVTETVEYIFDMVKANPDEDYFELAQEAVYLQVAVDRLVWMFNELSNRREE